MPTRVMNERAVVTGWGWGRWLWRGLTSMRTAIVLLTMLAAAAVPGSLLPQRNVASDPLAVTSFALEHPGISPWLDRLGLFDVYASPWFAAIYLLLLVSMTGCVLPRSVKLWRAVRAEPVAGPRHLARLEHFETWTTTAPRANVLERAQSVLRGRRHRVRVIGDEVRAERGYVREVGNLMFHLSLLVLLVGVGVGRLFGFEGRVALAEGGTFVNVTSEYDAFTPSVWTDVDGLEELSFTLEEFTAEFAITGPRTGEPRGFDAVLTYRKGVDGDPQRAEVRPNEPLNVNGTKFFLTGHGYAPSVTVRDGPGNVVSSGPVIFLPQGSTFASDGVIKAPDAQPTQLAFEGLFLPTAATGNEGPFSTFPDDLNPRLLLTAFTGDLGLNDGTPESIYTLDRSQLDPVLGKDGNPLRSTLAVGETMTLPDGQGSVTFDGVSRFANFQIAYDPGKEISLLAALMLLIGLTVSLSVGRRQVWVRVTETETGSRRVEVACRSVTRREAKRKDVEALLDAMHDDMDAPAPEQRLDHPAAQFEELRK